MFAFLLITWLYVTVFHRLSQMSSADTRILINYLQFVFIYLSTQAGNLCVHIPPFCLLAIVLVVPHCCCCMGFIKSGRVGWRSLYVPFPLCPLRWFVCSFSLAYFLL
jgi:hypothetical protein